jgi:hypothetical protein
VSTVERPNREVDSLRFAEASVDDDLKRGLLRLNPGTTKNDEGRAFPLNADLRQVFEWALELAKVRTYRTKVVRLLAPLTTAPLAHPSEAGSGYFDST